MKKIMVFMLGFLLLFTTAGCSRADMSKVKIECGTSSLYTEEEMLSAIEVIKEQFSTFEGCELHSLTYASDELCSDPDNLSWMNDLAKDQEEAFTECICFDSSFRSPKKGGGAWAANKEYTWSWWLARSDGGAWKLMTWGY